MIGARAIANELRDFLAANIVASLDQLDAEHGPAVPDPPAGVVDSRTDEPVDRVDLVPRLLASVQLSVFDVNADQWPFVLVVPGKMRRQVRVDVTDTGGVVYRREYEARVFVWARSDAGWHYTAAVRDRLLLAVTETLLRAHGFGTAGADVGDDLVERYSDVSPDPSLADTVAAGSVDVVVTSTEVLQPAAAPLADPIATVHVAADTLPAAAAHPALG